MRKQRTPLPPEEPVVDLGPPVPVISPDGVVGTVAQQELQGALDTGYQQATPQALAENKEKNIYGKGVLNQLEAGALGFLRGSSLGLSDLAFRKLAPGAADVAAKIKKYNPDESLAGELGSFLVPGFAALAAGKSAAKGASLLQGLVAGGGEGLGKIATKIVGENLAGSVAGAAVNMAAQSAVYQAAHNLSEDALGDKDLTAESILAHTGQAAILGAGLGAALPLVARGAQAIAESAPVRYVVSGAAKQFAKFFDPNRSLQLFTGAMKKELGAETGKRFQTAVDELAHDSGASLYSAGEVALDPLTAKLVKTADGPLPGQAEAYQRLEALKNQAGTLMGDTLKAADVAMAESGVKPAMSMWTPGDAEPILNKINRWEADALIGEGAAAKLRETVEEIGQKIGAKDGNLEAMHAMRRALDARVGGKNWESLAGEEIEVVKDLRRVLSTKIDQGLAELAGSKLIPADAVDRWKRLNRLASNLYTIEKPLAGAIARSEGNVNVLGLRIRDIGVGAIGAGVLGPAGVALGVANKALQTDTGLLMRAAVGEKLQTLAWAEQMMTKSQAEIASSVKGFLGGIKASAVANEGLAKFGAPLAYATNTKAEPTTRVKRQQDWFDETRKQILAVASNPEQFAATQGTEIQSLANSAPGVADALIGKQLQVYAYLARVMPKNPGMPFNIMNDQWKPADYEVQRFRKVVQVARSPLTVLSDLRAGTLTADQVAAVKELYPKLYESILDRVRQEVTSPDSKASYAQQLKLGQLFPGAVPTMAPNFVAAMQAQVTKPDTPGDKIRPPGGAVKLSKNYQTSTERAANR